MAKPIPLSAIKAILKALQPALDAKRGKSSEENKDRSDDKKISINNNKKYATKLSILERKRLTILYDLFYQYGNNGIKNVFNRLDLDKAKILKEKKRNFIFKFKATPDETKGDKFLRVAKNIALALLFFKLAISSLKLFAGIDIKKIIFDKIKAQFKKQNDGIKDDELRKALSEDKVSSIKDTIIKLFGYDLMSKIYMTFEHNTVDFMMYFFNIHEMSKQYGSLTNIEDAIEEGDLLFGSDDEETNELKKNKNSLLNATIEYKKRLSKKLEILDRIRNRNIENNHYRNEEFYNGLAKALNKKVVTPRKECKLD